MKKYAEGKFSFFKVVVIILVATIFFVAVVFLNFYFTGKNSNNVFLVGFIGPLSGDASVYGFNVQRSLQLAKKDLEADNIKLVSIDSKCEAEAARQAMKKLAKQGVQVVIGELCSGATLAAVSIAEQNKIVLISPASTSNKLNAISPYFFRTVPSDDKQVLFVSNLLKKMNVERLSILYSDNIYGKSFFNSLNKKFTDEKYNIVSALVLDEQKIGQIADEVLSVKPDAVFIVTNSPSMAVMAIREIKARNQEINIFGSEALKNYSIINEVGKQSEGMIVSSLVSENEFFRQNFLAEFNTEPSLYNLQAYDAFHIVYEAVKSGYRRGPEIADFFRTIDFNGVSGRIKFLDDGSVPAGYEAYQVHDGKFVKFENK